MTRWTTPAAYGRAPHGINPNQVAGIPAPALSEMFGRQFRRDRWDSMKEAKQ